MSNEILTRDEVCDKAKQLYDSTIRSLVESPENIGKMVIIDATSGDFEIDFPTHTAPEKLRSAHPSAQMFGIRIGFDVSDAIGASIVKTA